MKTKMKAAKTKSKTVKPQSQTEPAGPRGTEKKGKGKTSKPQPEMLTGNKGNEGMEDGAGLAIKWVLRKEIRPDAEQPRKNFEKGKLEELAASIKAVGIRAPLQVARAKGDWFVDRVTAHGKTPRIYYLVLDRRLLRNGGYEGDCGPQYESEEAAKRNCPPLVLVDGERRWRAAEMAGVERVPVMVVDTSAPDWEKKKLAIQVVLNQQHENLSALEEAAAYGKEIECGRHTAESLWKAVGISRSSLFGRLALNRVDERVRKALVAGTVTTSVATLLVAVPKEKVEAALEEVSGGQWGDGPMSFREAQRCVEEGYVRQLKNASFDVDAAYKLTEGMVEDTNPEHAGLSLDCRACPKRSGNMEGSGLKNPNVCTDPKCFDAKTKAAGELKVEEAKAEGRTILSAGASKGLFLEAEYSDEIKLKEDSGYYDLAERCEPLGYDHKKDWKGTLGKDCPKVTVAIDGAGKAHELVLREDAREALKKAGHKLERQQTFNDGGSYNNSAEHKRMLANQRKKKAMEKVAGPASAALLEKLVGLSLDNRLWPLIARSAFNHTSIDAHAFVAKRRGLTKVQTDCREKLEGWFKENGENGVECARMAVDLLFCACWNGGSNYTGGPKWEKDFVAACGWAGVKLEKLEEEMESKKEAHAKGGKGGKEKD